MTKRNENAVDDEMETSTCELSEYARDEIECKCGYSTRVGGRGETR